MELLRSRLNTVPAYHKLRLIKPFCFRTLSAPLNVTPTFSLRYCTFGVWCYAFHLPKLLRYFQASLVRLGQVMELTIKQHQKHYTTNKHSKSCNVLETKLLMRGTKKPVPTAETKCVFVTNCKRLFLFGEIIPFYGMTHKEI